MDIPTFETGRLFKARFGVVGWPSKRKQLPTSTIFRDDLYYEGRIEHEIDGRQRQI